MRVALTPCFILHCRLYRETSMLLDVFSQEYGRISLIANGVRRAKSKYQGLLQPYQRLLMAWRGKTELMTLTDAEIDAESYQLFNDRFITGCYVNELIIRLLHRHEPHPQLFTSYDRVLRQLTTTDNIQAALRIFEKNFLQSIGYGLILDREIKSGRRIHKNSNYYYLIGLGPTQAPSPTACQLSISGQSLLALHHEELHSDKEFAELKKLTRFVLRHYLGEKPLASRALYQAYLEKAK